MMIETNELTLSNELLLSETNSNSTIGFLDPLNLSSNNTRSCGCGSTYTISESLVSTDLAQINLVGLDDTATSLNLSTEGLFSDLFGTIQGVNTEAVINSDVNESSSFLNQSNILTETDELQKGYEQLILEQLLGDGSLSRNNNNLRGNGERDDDDDDDDENFANVPFSPVVIARRPFLYQNVIFTPFLTLLDNRAGTVQASLLAQVVRGTGSVSIEINNPFLYYDPINRPDPQNDFPCGIGTPSEVAGLTGATVFNFGNRARCTAGVGFYGFSYGVRVTNDQGTFPSPDNFVDAPPLFGRVIFQPTPVG